MLNEVKFIFSNHSFQTVSRASFYKIRKVECEVNAEFVENVTCIVKPVSWTRSVLNLDCDLKDDLTEVKVSWIPVRFHFIFLMIFAGGSGGLLQGFLKHV